MRLGERDELDLARSEKGLYLGRREQNPWGGQPTEQAHQIATIRSRYPYAELRDLTPHFDRLRMTRAPRNWSARCGTSALRRWTSADDQIDPDHHGARGKERGRD